MLRKAKENGGLIGMGGADWAKAIDEAVGTGKKITVAVVMLGLQDRQPLKQDAATFEPLTDPWREAYRARVDAAMKAFNDRKLPVVWIGLPPARKGKVSEDYLAMNEIYQESVQAQRRHLCGCVAWLRRRGQPLHHDRPRRGRSARQAADQ